MRLWPYPERATSARAGALLACLAILLAGPARAQDPAVPEAIRSDTDPTKPVLISLRNEYYDLLGERWQDVAILRADRLILNKVGLPGSSRGFLIRGDIPYVTIDNGTARRSGLGDLYAQALVIPRFNQRVTIAWGTGAVFPTATNTVGSGKWQLAPIVGPLVFFGRLKGFGFVKFQDYFSVTGDADRPDVHYFLVTPTILYRVARSWWIVADGESRTDRERNNTTSYKAGFQLGKMVSPRVGVSLKTEVPFGPDRLGDWTLKLVAYRTRY